MTLQTKLMFLNDFSLFEEKTDIHCYDIQDHVNTYKLMMETTKTEGPPSTISKQDIHCYACYLHILVNTSHTQCLRVF